MEKKKTMDVQRNATIVDVGKLANVSISTVSRVINHRGGVSPELEERILKVINQLDYRPNSVAQALKSKTTRLIGVIVPSIANPLFSAATEYYAAEAEKYGYSLITCSSNSSIDREIKCVNALVKHQVDGIIFNGMGIYRPEFEVIQEAKIPMVFVGKRMDQLNCDNVTLDNRAGAYQAVSYLIRTGTRRIAFVSGSHEAVTATDDRYAGYKAALMDHGIPLDEALIVRAESTEDDGRHDAVLQLLDRAPDVEAIFASTDMMALGCMEQLRNSGIRVPEQISVMGYDGIPYGKMMTPPLSSMVTPIREMVQRTVELLIQRIESSTSPQKEIVFQPTISVGSSTKPPL